MTAVQSCRAMHLADPRTEGRTFGTVSFNAGSNHWIIKAEPSVIEMAKRLFPGSGVRMPRGVVRFPATCRMFAELNWLMLRYPLTVDEDSEFMFDTSRRNAIEHAEKRAANADLVAASPPPTFTGTLYPFQAEGVSYLQNNERCLLADDMGLGKTVTCLAAMAACDSWPVLVVCPANVQRQWMRQAEAFLSLDGALLFDDGDGSSICWQLQGRTPTKPPARPIYVTHYGLLDSWRKMLESMEIRTIVFDEVQELRHTGTNKYSAASLLSSNAKRVWGLSGTPIYNYGAEIWAVLNAIDFQCLGNCEAFSREWCEGYGSVIVREPDVLGDYLRREGLMLRRRKIDVLEQLPPKRRAVVDVDHDESVYRSLIGELVQKAATYDDSPWAMRGQIAREIDTGMRAASGLAKAPYVADFVDGLLLAGERVLLFSHHHSVQDVLAQRLSTRAGLYQPVMITGRQTQAQKDEAVKRFADGNSNIAMLALRTAAGLDGLQGKATCVVFAELDWSPAIHTQCEDRLHRVGIGDVDSVLCYYLVNRTSIDREMLAKLGLKVAQFSGLMGDGDGRADWDGSGAHEHIRRIIDRLKAGEV